MYSLYTMKQILIFKQNFHNFTFIQLKLRKEHQTRYNIAYIQSNGDSNGINQLK